jgi:redox-sensitive bicupin YhaK (pirin superfamily)
VSNLEKDPQEILEVSGPALSLVSVPEPVREVEGIELLEPRLVPLGGPRAMPVRRTLPQRARSLIGAWCFVDHYGPDPVSETGGMTVPPHPHTGLQTVSWLFAGEIDHRDSVGSHALVRPGELNLMTAGRGIQHSEVGTPETHVLHGAQLWIALPETARHTAPAFERFVPQPFSYEGATISVFLGSLLGHVSTAHTFTAIVGAQLDLPAHTRLELPVDPTYEHGILVDAGAPRIEGQDVTASELAYLPLGNDRLVVDSGDQPLRALLIGGTPLGERILMWWNFIGRSHEEIVAFRQQWQSEVIADLNEDGRFGHVYGYEGGALPAPELPNVRLRPRD